MTTAEPTIVLVHGMWHGPWAWAGVTQRLEAAGHAVITPALPGVDRNAGDPTFAGHCTYLVETLSAAPGAVVLVGHSYAGALLSEVGDRSNVIGMVFVAAFALDVGETVGGVNDGTGSESGDDALIHDGDLLMIDADTARRSFYHDVPAEQAAGAIARLTPEHCSTRTTPVSRSAWRAKPSAYVVTTEDRAITVDVQRRLAARLTTSIELEAGHSPMLSRPDGLSASISTFANSFAL